MKIVNVIYLFFILFHISTVNANENKTLSKFSFKSYNDEVGLIGSIKLGMGTNIGSNGSKSLFKLEETKSKYALGNDLENEVIVGAYSRHKFKNNMYFHNQVGFKFVSEEQRTLKYSELDNFYTELGNIDTQIGNLKIWAGKKDYGSYSLAINDLTLIDIKGKGIGIENIDLKFAQLSYAYLRSTPLVVNNLDEVIGKVSQVNRDFRISDIKSNEGGKLTFWYNYADTKRNRNIQYPIKDGYAIGVFHDQELYQSSNTASFQYGTNLMYNLKGDYLEEAIEDALLYNNSKITRLTNSNKFEINENLYLFSLILYDELKSKNDNNANIKWTSIGIRPTYYLNNNIGLSLENGYDIVKNASNVNHLNKITFATQYYLDRKQSDKSLLKIYFTKALWNKTNNLESVSNKFNMKGRGTVAGIQLTYNF